MGHNLASLLRLMLVTDDDLVGEGDVVALAQAAVRGGVTAVQHRLKRASPRELCEIARALSGAVGVPVLVNDRVDVALAAGAAGVHLGSEDLPVALARRIVPPGFIVGASVGSADEAASAGRADYWGVGPWRTTGTKADAGEPLGPEGLRRIVARAGAIPCVAIGGVRPDDVGAVRAAGGVGVAIVSGILGAGDVEESARDYWRQGER
jgi:thiamine-phosphate diphosphorylase